MALPLQTLDFRVFHKNLKFPFLYGMYPTRYTLTFCLLLIFKFHTERVTVATSSKDWGECNNGSLMQIANRCCYDIFIFNWRNNVPWQNDDGWCQFHLRPTADLQTRNSSVITLIIALRHLSTLSRRDYPDLWLIIAIPAYKPLVFSTRSLNFQSGVCDCLVNKEPKINYVLKMLLFNVLGHLY